MSNDTPALLLYVPEQTLRRFYQFICLANSLLLFVTAASDLDFAFTQHRSILQFDLKLEGNIAVWYSSGLLTLTGLAALAISARVPPQITQARQYRAVWVVAALFFFGLSADETAQLHEWAGSVFTNHFGETPGLTEGSDAVFAWLVLLFPLIVCFLLLMKIAVKWLRIHQRSRRFAMGGVVCWVGVLTAEFIQAQMRRLSIERSVQGVMEEGLEITGTAFFLISFLEFLRYTTSKSDPAVPLRYPERRSG